MIDTRYWKLTVGLKATDMPKARYAFLFSEQYTLWNRLRCLFTIARVVIFGRFAVEFYKHVTD